MQVKYFSDTDTVLVVLNQQEIVETRELDENVYIDVDNGGNIVSMTIEHAKEKANIEKFSFEQIPAA